MENNESIDKIAQEVDKEIQMTQDKKLEEQIAKISKEMDEKYSKKYEEFEAKFAQNKKLEEEFEKKLAEKDKEIKSIKDDFEKQIDSIKLRKSIANEDLQNEEQTKKEDYWDNPDKHDREYLQSITGGKIY